MAAGEGIEVLVTVTQSTVIVDSAMLGEDDEEAELTTWLLPTDSLVEVGQPIAEVTVSKVVTEMLAPANGRLRHLVQEGSPVTAGQTIAVIEQD